MNGAYSWIKANTCACGKMATHYSERQLTPRDTQMVRCYLCDECLAIWRKVCARDDHFNGGEMIAAVGVPSTITAEATYNLAVTAANDIYATAMTVARDSHSADYKASAIEYRAAQTVANTTFYDAKVVALDDCQRATTAARVILIASKDAK